MLLKSVAASFFVLSCLLVHVSAFSPNVWSLRQLRIPESSAVGHIRNLVATDRVRNQKKPSSVKMQWMDSDELSQPQWSAFKAYNMGRWKGRSLHLSPETGDYIPPFSNDYVLDVFELEEGAQSAMQRLTAGNVSAPRMSELTISANDDFACSDDGSYSLDRSLVSLSDISGAVGETARFCIEMSVAVSEEERVRCTALYDFESKLSRIVLYEEHRVVSTGRFRSTRARESNLHGTFALICPLYDFAAGFLAAFPRRPSCRAPAQRPAHPARVTLERRSQRLPDRWKLIYHAHASKAEI